MKRNIIFKILITILAIFIIVQIIHIISRYREMFNSYQPSRCGAPDIYTTKPVIQKIPYDEELECSKADDYWAPKDGPNRAFCDDLRNSQGMYKRTCSSC